jgi:hypothetical protein
MPNDNSTIPVDHRSYLLLLHKRDELDSQINQITDLQISLRKAMRDIDKVLRAYEELVALQKESTLPTEWYLGGGES